MNLKDVTVLFWDLGLFVSVAEHLAPKFGKTYYFTSFEDAFPRDSQVAPGDGLPGVTRVHDPYVEVLNDADKDKTLVVFLDVFSGGLQEFLRAQGFRVWGPGQGEKLELDRLETKRLMKRLGMNVGPYEHIVGFEKLREHLLDAEDVYVKSRYARIRATFETKKWQGFAINEAWLEKVANKLGRRKATTEFIVEQAIPDAIEISSDRYCVAGQFSGCATMGIEVKGEGMLTKFCEEFPSQITDSDKLISGRPWADQYRQFFTSETRVTEDGEPWPIDPCCRMGRPMWGTVCTMYENLADILWGGAEGILVDPEPADLWCFELMIECSTVEHLGCVLEYPDKLNKFVFMSDVCIVEGRRVVMAADIANIGSVVGTGSSMDEAIKVALARAEKIRGDGIKFDASATEKASEAWDSLADYGVDVE